MKICKRSILGFIFALLLASAGASAADSDEINPRLGLAPIDGGYRDSDYWVWGSSIIKEPDGTFHMFASRWPKNMAFHPGWMVASEIVHAVSKTAEGPYIFKDVALGERSPQYWDGCTQHNPKIFKHKNTYILFYTGSTHPFESAKLHPEEVQLNSKYSIVGRSNKRIGVATAKSLSGPWTRMDQPILETKPDTFYSFLTSNAAPIVNPDGSVFMIFKSRSYNDTFPFDSTMNLGVATAPHYLGPYTVLSEEPIFSKERFGIVEDPFLWKDRKGYHMIAKDQYGQVAGIQHAGILAHSQNGLKWRLDKNPTAYTTDIKWSDGSVTKMGQMERVQGITQNGRLTHLSFAVMDGIGGFHRGTNSWNVVIPLNVSN